MKKTILILLAIALILTLCACGGGNDQSGTLKIYVDGKGFQDPSTMVSAFWQEYPNIQVEVEVLPELELNYDSNYIPSVDTDSMAEREAVLQQHRTALMAGSSDADLYLIGGGMTQFAELNGGALV